MVRGDQKDFAAAGWKIGIAVLEVTTPDPVLEHAQSIIFELRMLKKEKGYKDASTKERDIRNELDFAYLFVVDIVKQNSFLLLCGGREYTLAQKAFPETCQVRAAQPDIVAPGHTIEAGQTLMEMPDGFVSRKLQFVPAFLECLENGFSCHKHPNSERKESSPSILPQSNFDEKLFLHVNEEHDWVHDSVR